MENSSIFAKNFNLKKILDVIGQILGLGDASVDYVWLS